MYQNDSDEDISDDNIISNSYKLDSASADRHSAPVNAEEIFSPSITNEQNIYDSNLLFSRSRSLHKSVVTNRSNSYMKPTPSRYDNLISGTNELMGRSAYTNHNESKTSLERMFDSVAVSASNDAGISSEDAVVVESDKDLGLYNESVDVEEVVVRKSSEYQVEKAEDLADVVNSENNDKTIASDSKSKEALKKELSAVNVQEERSDEMYDEIAQKPTETEVTAIVNHSTPSAAKGSIDVEESIGNTEGSTNKTTKDRSPDDITDTDGEGNDSIKDEEERHRLSIESGADVLIDTPEKVVEIPLVPSSHNDDNSGDEAEEHNEEMDRFSSPKIEMLKRTRSYESMTPKEILWAVLFEGLVVIKHGKR